MRAAKSNHRPTHVTDQAQRGTLIVRVAVPVPLPREFDYRWPARHPNPSDLVGCRVRVPFGRRNIVGIVTDTDVSTHEDAAGLKVIDSLLDEVPIFDEELQRSLTWAANYYHFPLGEVLAAALPAPLRIGKAAPDINEPAFALTPDGVAARDAGRLRPGPGCAVLDALHDGPLPVATLRERLGPPGRAAIARLRRRGWIESCRLSPTLPDSGVRRQGPPLNPDQRAACDAVLEHADGFHTFLLDGVTGSGKTEVYLTLIARTLERGRQALVLVPEIALTPQALKRYRERLPVPVLALHSGLTDAERARTWARARTGQPCVILGTRSAVFTPLPKAGLIVIDEEHDASYKQADGFRYHARDLALVRAKALAVPIVLGSATPSLETLARVADGRVERLSLTTRAVHGSKAPTLRLLDLHGQPLTGGVASPALTAIEQTLARGEQALVFRNRRGFARVLACAACGWHADCPRCDRPFTVHLGLTALICHHCGFRRPLPAACPVCAATTLDTRGLGTERIETELRARFPEHRVLRIDRDSARSAAQLDAAFADIERGEPMLLVGTQLLAKGHDWSALTLVVIADADSGLFSPDFRAPERLAQGLTQVAGRAGRGERPGTVIVQTRHPGHPFWSRWLHGGHAAVAAAELDERRASALPPFRHQALLAAEARTTDALDAFFAAISKFSTTGHDSVDRLGPLPAPMPRRAGHHRAQLLFECDARPPLHALLSTWIPQISVLKPARRIRWSLDVDPLDLY